VRYLALYADPYTKPVRSILKREIAKTKGDLAAAPEMDRNSVRGEGHEHAAAWRRTERGKS
jgi:hypothetical protein